MRRRRVVVGLAGLALVGAGVACLSRPYPPGPGGRWASLDRVAVGMTRAEVITVIGVSPQFDQPGNPMPDFGPADTRWTMMWSGDECDIWVYLDGDGRVVGRQGFGPPPPPWPRRLRARLGL